MILALLLVQQLAAQPVTPPPGWRESGPKIDPKMMMVDGHSPRNCHEQCEMMDNMAKSMCKDPSLRKRMRGVSPEKCSATITTQVEKMCKKTCKNGKFDEAAIHQYAQDARANAERQAKRSGSRSRSATDE